MTPEASCEALTRVFDGYVPHPLVIGAAVLDGAECAQMVAPPEFTDHRFEIGSIGKTMTAVALSTLVLDGTLGLESEIGAWLDGGPNATITIGQLLTHTSGLPRLAPNHADRAVDPADPYAAYGPDDAEAGLRAAERSAGGAELYSNFGYQLAGLILVRATGQEFGDVLRERLWEPLGMRATSVTGEQEPIVGGYDGTVSASAWHAALPGPGSVTSTLADMAAYAGAIVQPSPSQVGPALRYSIDHRLGWAVTGTGWVWHNGGTRGARSMLAARPEARRGVVALSNSGRLEELDAAVHLVALGEDPRPARPQPAGDQFEGFAQAVIDLLVANDWQSLRGLMVDSTREALTTQRLGAAWSAVMGERGPVLSTRIDSAVRILGHIQTRVELTFAQTTGWAIVSLSEDGELTGLRIE